MDEITIAIDGKEHELKINWKFIKELRRVTGGKALGALFGDLNQIDPFVAAEIIRAALASNGIKDHSVDDIGDLLMQGKIAGDEDDMGGLALAVKLVATAIQQLSHGAEKKTVAEA